MDNQNYQDEFEQFLQDEVKQHRMYPSDHIWKNIRTELHGYKAWPALTFISLFIITALTISTLINNHPDQHLLVKSGSPVVTQAQAEHANPPPMAAATVPASNNYFEKIAPEQITAETFGDIKPDEILLVTRSTISDNALLPVPTQPFTNRSHHFSEKIVNRELPVSASPQELDNTMIIPLAATEIETPVVTEMPGPLVVNTPSTEVKTEIKRTEGHLTADNFLKDFGYVSAVPRNKNAKIGFQVYVTPSTSYRKLSDEKVKEVIQPAAAQSQNVPLSLNRAAFSTDVNNVVRHRPAIGLEMGFAVLYNINPRLKLKTGMQLNIRQYYIETFQSLTNDLTSLSLINYGGIETISFYSPYNNNTGYRQTQLDNKVYQVSIPVGVQWEMIQGKHFGINSEASVQPTLTLNNNTYLLSTDYKHYTDGKDFMRKWNINTSLGLNLTFRSGASSWQLGPQIRYQHLPTYSNAYPVKEFLIDYGVRLGFTKQIR